MEWKEEIDLDVNIEQVWTLFKDANDEL
jgi:hypothetical protein